MNTTVENIRAQRGIRRKNRIILSISAAVIVAYVTLLVAFGVDLGDVSKSIGSWAFNGVFDWFEDAWL